MSHATILAGLFMVELVAPGKGEGRLALFGRLSEPMSGTLC